MVQSTTSGVTPQELLNLLKMSTTNVLTHLRMSHTTLTSQPRLGVVVKRLLLLRLLMSPFHLPLPPHLLGSSLGLVVLSDEYVSIRRHPGGCPLGGGECYISLVEPSIYDFG